MIKMEGKEVRFISYFIKSTGISIPISSIGYSVLPCLITTPLWMNTDEYRPPAPPPKVDLGKGVDGIIVNPSATRGRLLPR